MKRFSVVVKEVSHSLECGDGCCCNYNEGYLVSVNNQIYDELSPIYGHFNDRDLVEFLGGILNFDVKWSYENDESL